MIYGDFFLLTEKSLCIIIFLSFYKVIYTQSEICGMIKFDENSRLEYISSGLFKSEGEWCHPRRVIDTYEIIFMYEGVAYIREDGVEYTLKKNDVLLLEPYVEHMGFRTSEEFTSFSWLHFHTTKKEYQKLPKYFNAAEPYVLKTLFSQCLHTAHTPTYNKICSDLYTALIIEEIINIGKTSLVSKNYLASQIKEYITVNIENGISVKDVASHFGYHENHVSRVFKASYGMGLKAYISKLKLEYAQNLLLTSLYTVKQIAMLLSFESENHFIKFFKYHLNITPTEYRNNYGNTHINKA